MLNLHKPLQFKPTALLLPEDKRTDKSSFPKERVQMTVLKPSRLQDAVPRHGTGRAPGTTPAGAMP